MGSSGVFEPEMRLGKARWVIPVFIISILVHLNSGMECFIRGDGGVEACLMDSVGEER